ncbi:hypothetical protein TNIN_13011 [Trichonephila inaurata madagascariensis]|uniref:Uncharacterized protein n=1 Tax=Trichonephila inaurata madagascariensis TaxID=2747483 RepID=A0A8X6YBT8_9ARAC|nr:hypothetical protein TNIN_13011 [Trichonephila inaurata madagascariensis]
MMFCIRFIPSSPAFKCRLSLLSLYVGQIARVSLDRKDITAASPFKNDSQDAAALRRYRFWRRLRPLDGLLAQDGSISPVISQFEHSDSCFTVASFRERQGNGRNDTCISPFTWRSKGQFIYKVTNY